MAGACLELGFERQLLVKRVAKAFAHRLLHEPTGEARPCRKAQCEPRGLLGESLDRAQLEDVVHRDQRPLELEADDQRAPGLADRADPRLARVGLVLVELHRDAGDAIADGDRHFDRPLHGDAVLRDVEHLAEHVAGSGANARHRLQRSEIAHPVPVRTKVNFAPLGAVEIFVGADSVERHGQEVSSAAAARRTSNRAPPCGRSTTAISP